MIKNLKKFLFTVVVLNLAIAASATGLQASVLAPDVVKKPEEILIKDLTEEFDGYIIELKQTPLVEKKKQLEETKKIKIENNVQNMILSHGVLLAVEQDEAETVLKNIAPKAHVDKKFTMVLNGFSVKNISSGEIQKLKNQGYNIWPDYKVKILLIESAPLIGATQTWNNIKDSQGKFVTGTGIKIGIIDTGVDYTHPDLGGCLGNNCKVAGGYDFANNDGDPKDDNGHGTHVAATAAGNGILKGIAPDAKIYAYKVLSAAGAGSASSVISAIERAVDPNQDGNFSDHLDVINLSLGGAGNPDDFLSKAIDNAVNAGVIAVVSAGNSGPGIRTIGSPGTARKAITVGATYKSEYSSVTYGNTCSDQNTKVNSLACFSSKGPVTWNNNTLVKPDIVAPGVGICAAQWETAFGIDNNYNRPTRPDIGRCVDSRHMKISGTSMAAPHVAGAAALIKQLHPDWTPEQVKYALRNTALDTGLSPFAQGAGRIDILKAAQLSTPPLVAQLKPITIINNKSNSTRDIITVKGTISAQNFKNYSISYSSANSINFIPLTTSYSYPADEILYRLDLNRFSAGDYILRLTAEDSTGQKAIDYGFFNILLPNNAACGGIGIAETSITAGQKFSAGIYMRNTGFNSWTTDSTPHRLGSQDPQDNSNWGTGRIGLPIPSIGTNEGVFFFGEFTAPKNVGGNYKFSWRMVEEAVEWFGESCTKTINIIPPPPPPLPISSSGLASHLYTCVLERTPGQSEIDYWNNLLKSKTYTFEQEYQFFFNSQEYKLKNTSNDKYVNQLYRCVLFRNPGQSEIDYWSNFLTNNTRTRIQEAIDFTASIEYILYIKPKLDALYK